MRSLKFRAGAVVLALGLLLTQVACSAQWLQVAIADLPVLTQMALNIATLVSTLEGKVVSPGDIAAIQNISNEASRDLSLLQTLYSQYKANPSNGTLQKIQDVIATINANLPAALQAAHVGDPLLEARVTAAVNLIITTVNSFAALIPPAKAAGRHADEELVSKPPTPKELKAAWNRQVYPQFK